MIVEENETEEEALSRVPDKWKRDPWSPARLKEEGIEWERMLEDEVAKKRAEKEKERERDYDDVAAERDHEGEHVEPKKPRWCTPLTEFLGDTEPDDDDSEDWNIRDLIPRGEPALFVGRAKGGKTWAMLAMAICMAMGLPWMGFENTRRAPIKVMVVALEDSQRRLRKRVWEICRGLGISPLDPVLRANLIITRQPLRLPDGADRRAFEAEAKAWGPQVVWLDNLTRVMSGDQNKTHDAALFCTVWMQMCLDLGANFTYLHHLNKNNDVQKGKGDPFDRIRGAGAFVDAARHVVLTLPKEFNDDRKLSEVRMRGNLEIRRPPFMLEFERTLTAEGRPLVKLIDKGDAAEAIASETEKRKAEKKAKADQAQREVAEHRRSVAIGIAVKKGVVSGRDLADALGLSSENSVRQVLQSLASSNVLKQDGRRGYVLADADPQQPIEGAQ